MNHAIRRVATGMMLIATLPAALAQANYPTQPVRFIVTTAPGGGLDNYARLVAIELTGRAGLEVVANSPEEFAALINTDIAKWTKVVKAIGIPLM